MRYGAIAKVEELSHAVGASLSQSHGQNTLLVWCKDLRVVTITFNRQPKLASELLKRVLKAVASLAFTEGTSKASSFAFRFQMGFNPARVPNGWR